MKTQSPESEIDSFLAKFNPDVEAEARAARKKLRAVMPGAIELVYDNYNALVFGFSPTERPSDAVLSIAVFPQWVTLCFLQGARLPDSKKLLKGGGNQVRHLRLAAASDLDKRDICSLMARTIKDSAKPFAKAPGPTVIRSVSAKQRPRRPKQ